MTKWGMVIDLDKCTGCQACVVACKAENNVPFVEEDQMAKGRIMSWIQMVPVVKGEYPDVRAQYIPMPCMQCENPPCVKVCPVGATLQNPEGLVGMVYPRCIGTKYCAVACPYTKRYFNWKDPEWPEEMRNLLNPEVSLRYRGVMEVCNFCTHRIRKAQDKAKDENRPVRDGEVQPACVQSCPSKAMYFGDLEDPESTVSKLKESPRAFRLMEELGTEPKVFYLSEDKWYA